MSTCTLKTLGDYLQLLQPCYNNVNFHDVGVKAGNFATNSVAVNNIRRLRQINEVHERKSRALNFSTSLWDRDRLLRSGEHKAVND